MSASEDIKKQVNSVIIENLVLSKDTELKPETRIVDDLGADELDEIELCMGLEEEFGMAIPEEDMQNFKTVQGIYDYIDKRLNS